MAASALLPWSAAGAIEPLSYTNQHPEIQMWSYPAGSANGVGAVRDRGPTFAAFSGINSQGQPVFYPGSGLDPSRRGSFLIAANTSTMIPAGLAPGRYRIDSLRVTATLLGNLIFEPAGRVIPYDNTLDDAVSLTTGADADPGHPIEMYGVGLQGDYQTISFAAEPVANALQLGDVRWRRYRDGEPGYDPLLPANQQAFAPYQFFAIDAAGRDVENSILSGGYSATEPSGVTQQFTPEPFAIGRVYDSDGAEYAPGALTDNGDVFVFEPDLSDARIVEYVQRSLAEGRLGFSFSSMHQPAGHTGTVAYPDFYLDDLDVGNNPDGAAPTLELVVTLLDASTPGDYDGNGVVNTLDYGVWASGYGGVGPAADGNSDGVIDAADYTIWRDRLGDASSQAAIAVPEPGGATLLGMVAAGVAFFGWMRWYIGPLAPEEPADD
jgi:hypothetical protein